MRHERSALENCFDRCENLFVSQIAEVRVTSRLLDSIELDLRRNVVDLVSVYIRPVSLADAHS